MPYEQVDNPNPVTVPAVPEKVYDKLWITRIMVESPAPDQQANAVVVGIPWDGAGSILAGPVMTKTIPNIFGMATVDQDVADAINALLKVVNKYGGMA